MSGGRRIRSWLLLILLFGGCTRCAARSSGFEGNLRRTFALRAESLDPIGPTCFRNTTHCTCRGNTYHQMSVAHNTSETQSKLCSVGKYEREEMECGCPGDSLCEVRAFECNKVRRIETQQMQQTHADALVECAVERSTCFKAFAPQTCSSHSKIWIDGVFAGCVEHVPVRSDVDDAYMYADGHSNMLNGSFLDYVNVRMVETTANEEVHLCVILGNWQAGLETHSADLNMRKAKSRVTATFPVGLEIMDDFSDQVVGDGSRDLILSHAFPATESDGFCAGPLLNDGSGFRAVFYDLSRILGVNVQSYTTAQTVQSAFQWTFRNNREPNLLRNGYANGDDSVTIDVRPSCDCETESTER